MSVAWLVNRTQRRIYHDPSVRSTVQRGGKCLVVDAIVRVAGEFEEPIVIRRPKQSVTRFFIPLIDVLILLFCMFLLMPYVSQPDPDASAIDLPSEREAPLASSVSREHEHRSSDPSTPRSDLERLQLQLRQSQREVDRLQAELREPVSVRVFDIDPRTGRLFTFDDEGQRQDITTMEEARRVIQRHLRQVGSRRAYFLILLPRQFSGKPNEEQIEQYRRWFAGHNYSFDNPLGRTEP